MVPDEKFWLDMVPDLELVATAEQEEERTILEAVSDKV